MIQIVRRLSKTLLWSVVPITLILVLGNRQGITDWLRLRNYDPPSVVSQLATDTTMTNAATRLFYVHRPLLEDRTNFNNHCTDSESTIVLGCYVSREGIYIYDVTNERLTGIEQVTAAHELLHAAYDRLGSKEKARINDLLDKTYKALTNARLSKTVEQYRQRDPAVVPNELHSILGTEVRDLPTELENYYKRYFSDRKRIVAYSEAYEQVFSAQKDKIAGYDKQLQSLKGQIETYEKSLQNQLQDLNATKSQMDNLLTLGEVETFNQTVPEYNASVARYNRDAKETRKLIDQYNNLVSERNSLVTEEQELINAIDSRPKSIQGQ